MSTNNRPVSPGAKPHVIIVGAGIGGLTLALLLERAGVSYVVLEKTSSIKPLGSALSLSGTVTSLLQQLGLLKEFQDASLKLETVNGYDGDCKPAYLLNFDQLQTLSGSDGYIVARPVLYEMLYNKVPKEKIHLNKRVLSILNGDVGARVNCTDGSTFDGDIIVGADGAYSPVRQGLFKWLKKNNRLPPSDDALMPYKYVCLVGQTKELDPEEFPELEQTKCDFDCMVSITSPYTWVTFTTKQRTICWMVVEHLNETSSKEHDSFRNSEWGPEAAEAMANSLRDFPIVSGRRSGKTLGDLIDKTDKDLISKVVLEEKVYKAWYGGRTVLLGDACHKLNPAGGAGAMSAMHDALCLANWLNVLPSLAVEDTESIFKEYYNERYPFVMEAYKASVMRAKGMENNLGGAIARFINANLPKWIWTIILKKSVVYRPQASFLDPVKDMGTVRPCKQLSLIKTKILLDMLAKKQQQRELSSTPSSTTSAPVAV